jgi:hypothetical protein
MIRQRHTKELAGAGCPHDDTLGTVTTASKAQTRYRGKKGAKAGCTAVWLQGVSDDCGLFGLSLCRNGCLAVRTLIVKKVLPQISPKIKGFVRSARNEG